MNDMNLMHFYLKNIHFENSDLNNDDTICVIYNN